MPMVEKGSKVMQDFMSRYGKKAGKAASVNKNKPEGKGKLYSLLQDMK